MKYELKPEFRKRMELLLPDKKDFAEYEKIIHKKTLNFIRCNTLKISPAELMKRLGKKWDIIQPWEEYPEIMLVKQDLSPGELGNSLEHILGLYYIQEASSMMPPIVLEPKPGELILDLMASPGSKTTQISAKMQNQGTIIANDLKLNRIKILASNLERCGVSNCIVSRNDAVSLCSKLAEKRVKFDKILLDVTCSGEGTLRSSPKTFIIWNKKIIEKLGRMQKKFISSALKCLKKGGTLVYSTCTHAPEENEEVIDFAIKNFPVEVESFDIPLKKRPGISEWKGKKFHKDIKKCARIYPQDNDTEGFFICKLKLIGDLK